MPNGSGGLLAAWRASDDIALELVAAVGGGGIAKLPGGLGLQFQGSLIVPRIEVQNGLRIGPMLRATWRPLMADVVRGGAVQYYSIDLGICFLVD
jgi:hypothetical protein